MSVTAITPITALPTAPDSTQQSTFDARANAFVAALADFVTDANALASGTNSNASAAETAATSAESANTSAVAASNYKGEWSDLTGGLNIPASVQHSGEVWLLDSSLADVTLSEPGVSSDWLSISTKLAVSVKSSSATLTSSSFQHVHIDTSGVTLTLPSTVAVGSVLIVTWGDFSDCIISRNGHKIQGLSENLNLDTKSNGAVQLGYVSAAVGFVIFGGA